MGLWVHSYSFTKMCKFPTGIKGLRFPLFCFIFVFINLVHFLKYACESVCTGCCADNSEDFCMFITSCHIRVIYSVVNKYSIFVNLREYTTRVLQRQL